MEKGQDIRGWRQTPPQILKVTDVIYPNQTTGKSYFTHLLYPILQHDRCKSCHALGSKDALVQRHHGILTHGQIGDVQGLIGMNLGCDGGCHAMIKGATQPVSNVIFHDSEWKTPRFDMGIDWRGKSAEYICQKVTSSLTTPKMLRDHFFHDARIAWAVHSGEIPPPVGGKLSKAPPATTSNLKVVLMRGFGQMFHAPNEHEGKFWLIEKRPRENPWTCFVIVDTHPGIAICGS